VLFIALEDRTKLDVLRAFLAAVHVQVVEVREDGLLAAVPGAPSPLHEQRELAGYVTTFNALNPGYGAALATSL
jgi:hypothetical protein